MICNTVPLNFSHLSKSKKKNARSWFSLGREVGMEVVDDEVAGAEEDQTEEDKEVQRIVSQGKGIKRKLVTGKEWL